MESKIPVNKYQTPITEELLQSLPLEVQDQLFDYINNVPFIQNLISPNREYAKDRPRDDKGRIIVDLSNPHILENMDYFRPSAIHFQKYGCYTFLRPNPNPNSEFGKWFKEEVRRCWEGYVRPSDGEWITGYMYYYMNYSPIMLSKIEEGTNIANRVEDFPETWEGIYLRFHYLEQARRGGLFNSFKGGQHCIELARRGCSKSFSLASIMAHNFVLGENSQANKRTMTVLTAYQKEYLAGKDGTLNKFTPMIDFVSQHTQFPRKRLKNSNQEMTWQMGYKDVETGVDKGTLNTVIGVSSKDDESKLRGKRGYILVEEMGSFPKLLEIYNITRYGVEEGDYTFGLIYLVGTSGDSESDFGSAKEMMYSPSGYNIYALPNVFDKVNQGRPNFGFFFPAYVNRKGCYDKDGNSDVIKALIQILQNRYHTKYNSEDPNTITKVIAEMPITPAEAIIKVTRTLFPVTDLSERLLQIENNPTEYDDVYVGELVINNGKVDFKPTTASPIRSFPHKDNKISGAIEIFKMPEKDPQGKVFPERYILGCLKEGELVNTDKGLKKVEDVTLEDKLISINGEAVGIKNLQRYHNVNPVYKVKLSSIIDSTTFSEEHPIYCCTPKRKYNSYKKVKELGVPERYYEYNFDFRRVAELKVGDYVKSPILYKEECIDNVKFYDPDIWYLLGVILGDGWTSKTSTYISFNTKEQELINRCKNIVETKLNRKFTVVKNKQNYCEYCFSHKVFTEYFDKYFGKYAKGKHISNDIKNIPYELRRNLILGYIDSDGCISRNSVNIVSISKRLLCDIQDWLFSLGVVSSIKKLRDKDVNIINNRYCNTETTYQLNIGTEGLNLIKDWSINCYKVHNYNKVSITNHNRKDVFIDGNYVYLKVKSITTSDYVGTVYNFECDTHTFMCNYIPTHNCDPYDDDSSETMSLGSIFVLDLWTDRIVAEYTGRPMFAEDFFETCRRLCLFYNGKLNYENNKKGLYAHFKKMNSLFLLTDVLEFLKDKDMIKADSLVGNKLKGTGATAPINGYAISLQRDWLLKTTTDIQNIDGESVEVEVPNLYKLRNKALIQEYIAYNQEGNFDRISAMGMLMLLREDRMVLYGGEVKKTKDVSQDKDYLGNDDFFSKNFSSNN